MKKIKLKIIAGKYKQKTIVSYGEQTRETSSLIRGAVFNMLYKMTGIGLDLFAGSGAYGFEGLSRGLDMVYLNDKDKDAYRSLTENKATLNANALITNLDYEKAISHYLKEAIYFDYIFLDPPYDMDINMIIEAVSPLLKPNGYLVCEIEKKGIYSLSNLTLIKDKTHGIKKILILQNCKST